MLKHIDLREKKLTIKMLSIFLLFYPILEGISNEFIPIGTKYLGFMLAGVWVLDLLYTQKMRVDSKMGLFLLYILWASASILWSVYVSGSINRLMGYVQVFILYYIICDVVKNKETLVKLITSYVIGVCILATSALYNVVFKITYYGDRFTSIGQDPNYFGIWLATIIPLCYFLYLEKKSKKYIFIIIVSVPLIIATSSRAAFLALGVIAIAYLFMSLKSVKKIVLMTVMLSIFAALIIKMVPAEAIERLVESSGDLSGSGRNVLWEQAWHLGAEKPFTGNGAGTFPYLSYGGMFAHNTFLSNWADLGIIGVVLWCGLWLSNFLSASRLKIKGTDKYLKIGLLCVMIINAIGALTLNWEIQKSVFIVWGFCAVLSKCVSAEEPKKAIKRKLYSRSKHGLTAYT